MCGERLADLPGPERIVRSPLEGDVVGSALALHIGLRGRLKDGLPRTIDAGSKVPDIGDLFFGEPLPDVWGDAPRHVHRVGERRLPSAAVRRVIAVEQEPQRPLALERLLVVHRDVESRRTLGGREHAVAEVRSWRGPIVGLQRVARQIRHDVLEVPVRQAGAPDQNGAACMQCRGEPVAVRPDPLARVTSRTRLEYSGKHVPSFLTAVKASVGSWPTPPSAFSG